MSPSTLVAIFAALNFAGAAWFLLGPWECPGWWRPFEAPAAGTVLAASLLGRDWAGAGFALATLVVLARDWWNRKGKRVLREFGAKSRARLAAVVEKLREAGTPVPQGVRA